MRIDSDRTCFSSGVSGWTSTVSSCGPAFQSRSNSKRNGLPSCRTNSRRSEFLAVGPEEEPAAVVVVDAVDESLVRRQVQDQLVPAVVLDRGRWPTTVAGS